MTGTLHPVEVELKYRVLDLKAAERYLTASDHRAIHRRVAAALDATRGSLRRHARPGVRAGRASRSGSARRGPASSCRSSPAGGARRATGPFARDEIEGPAIRAAGPSDWPPSDARSLVLELAGDAPLVEVVTIRQLRRKRQLRDGSTRVELSLDEVDVVVSKRVVARFVELEAELVRGDRGAAPRAGHRAHGRPGAPTGDHEQARGRARRGSRDPARDRRSR